MSDKDKRKAERAEKLRNKQEDQLKKINADEQKKQKEEEDAKRRAHIPDELTAKGYKISDDEISSGKFGTVFKAKYKGEDIAVRIVEKEKQNQKFIDVLIPRFVRILRALDERHPNIISTLDVYETSVRVLILTRLTVNCSLYDYLDRQTAPIDEKQCKFWAQQLISALTYLHINGVVHRDLRTERILMDQKNCLKITGFTYSRLWMNVANNSLLLSNTSLSTSPYCAPETLGGDKYDPRTADVWAYGVIVFYMWNNRYPFDYNQMQTLLSHQRSKEWVNRLRKDSKPDMKTFFNKLFDYNQQQRQRIEQLIADKWLDTKITIDRGKAQPIPTNNPNQSNQKTVAKQSQPTVVSSTKVTAVGSDEEDVFDAEDTAADDSNDSKQQQQTNQKPVTETNRTKTLTKTISTDSLQKSGDGHVLRTDILDLLKQEFRSLQ